MPITCTPQSLATDATCFNQCIPRGMEAAVHSYLLAQIRAALVPGASTDPNVIAQQATCYRCLDGMQSAVQDLLLCNIVNAVGG